MPSDSTPYILAIDLGTSGPKVALVSMDGQILDWEFQATELLLLPEGGAEQNPDQWWGAIKLAISRLIGKCRVSTDQIVALSCTSQWSGTVAVDREGKSLMNAMIWMDSRGAPYAKAITGGLIRIRDYGLGRLFTWLRLTGGVPTHSGKDPIAHILYIKNQIPQVYQRAHKFLEPKDYLNLRLTGRVAASTESITLHWLTDNRNISRIRYDDRLIAMSGIDRDKLPDLKRALDVLGPIDPRVAQELGLGEHVQVMVGTPDVHSTAIGSGAVGDYQAHLYIGTSSWLSCHMPFKKSDLMSNMASLPSALPDRYLLINEQECAGACLNFLKDSFGYQGQKVGATPSDFYKELDQVAERASAGSGKVIFTPWLYGERSPLDDSQVRGGFFNLSLRTTREQLVRAVFEGVAYNSRWLLGYVEKFINRRLPAIHLVGGGAKSDLWCQIYADVLDRPIKQLKDPHLAGLRGAGFLAAVTLGYLKLEQIPDRAPVARTYQPNPKHRAIYDGLFEQFRGIYRSNRAIYAKLNRTL